MADFAQIGRSLFDHLAIEAEEYELTSVVFAAEQLQEGRDRIELRPRSNKVYTHAVWYCAKMPLGGKFVFTHYVFYSKTRDTWWQAKRRIDCAHELGHILLHNDMLRNGTQLTEEQEIEADWFAICLLQMHGYVTENGRWSFDPVDGVEILLGELKKSVKIGK